MSGPAPIDACEKVLMDTDLLQDASAHDARAMARLNPAGDPAKLEDCDMKMVCREMGLLDDSMFCQRISASRFFSLEQFREVVIRDFFLFLRQKAQDAEPARFTQRDVISARIVPLLTAPPPPAVPPSGLAHLSLPVFHPLQREEALERTL